MLLADKQFIAVIAALVAGCIAVMLASREGERNQCKTYAEVTGRQTKFESGACYVKHSDGEWYLKGERR